MRSCSRNCKRKCIHTYFKTEETKEDIREINFDNNNISIFIKKESSTIISYEAIAKYSFIGYFSQMAGLVSLWLGESFVGIYYLFTTFSINIKAFNVLIHLMIYKLRNKFGRNIRVHPRVHMRAYIYYNF